jgi:hypothetical protein
MHCHGRVSSKGFAGAGRFAADSCGYAQRWQGHAPKNLNTVHFLMKRFNKI